MTVISSSSQFDRRALLGAGIGGAGLLATGCSIFDSGSGGGGGGGGDGEDGPAITIARTSDIDSLDPHYVNRSEEHTSELQSRGHLVCRLLLEKKKTSMHTSQL